MTAQPAYSDFLRAKAIVDPPTGLNSFGAMPPVMKDHQAAITPWLLRRGRAALFAGTGLGKTLMELVWALEVARATGRPVLHLAPLAVTAQIVREAVKFGIPLTEALWLIVNYQRLDRLDLGRFGGVILDESSILKSFDGHYRTLLIASCASIPYRLAATATPAPNDLMEIGNHAEFLGIMSVTDMLATFFVHDGGDVRKWRLKGHAEDDFWRWVASWAVMLRKPSDLGFSDDGYDLPPLHMHEHRVEVDFAPNGASGLLFPMEAVTLQERLAARRASVAERCARAIDLTPRDDFCVWWCNLNEEADRIARAIPGAVNLHGGLKDSEKERIVLAFNDGSIRHLVTKCSIAGFGLNWQHCADTGFVGLNDSFEQYYQAIRRFWRFGQTRPVNCHVIAAETEGATVANIRRKEADADEMAAQMVRHMADLSAAEVRGSVRDTATYQPAAPVQVPAWLEAA